MRPPPARRPLRIVLTTLTVALTTVTAGCFSSDNSSSSGGVPGGSLAQAASLKDATFVVGSKEFTEQLVLCHITSLALRSAGATVTEKCGLQGSQTTRAALTSGSTDMYWEYTGTAWINYLKHTEPLEDPVQQYDEVAKQDLAENHIKWLTPAPFNNTYAVGVKAATADQLGVKSISDYARLAHTDPSKASMCVATEFAGRSDGWPGLQKAYGFELPKANTALLAEGAIYNAIAKGNPCNFGETTTTDGRLQALDLKVLNDDKTFFPIYNPALTVRESVYNDHPDLAKFAEPLARAMTDVELQKLNGDVDVRGKDAAKVAEAWLQDKGFIGKATPTP